MTTTGEEPATDAQGRYADASIRRVTAENGIEYAYHDLGAGEVPLVLLQHFRGNLDNWDPALIDDLAAGRRVVTFDNRGVGGTTGMTPNTIEAMAHDAIAFVAAMGLKKMDLLGFSIGSFVAQEIALIRPDLLRRVVLASSAPQGADGMHGWSRARRCSSPRSSFPGGRTRSRRSDAACNGSASITSTCTSSTGQVLLRWCIERGIPVIPKSTHRERIAENAQLFDFRLSDEDIAELDALDRTGGTDRALERTWWRS
jgi:pimeloyl-ACP methyl ester carboxylesterase